MTTEIILVELNVYEKNMNQLIADYQRVHENYMSTLRVRNITESKILLAKLESLNQEIQLLTSEISSKINQMNGENNYGKYKNEIEKKKIDLNALHEKMLIDEKNIKELFFDTIDLDGKNETLRVDQKSSVYYMYFYIFILVLITIYIVKIFTSDESEFLENIMLFLAILLFIYIFWSIIISGASALTDSAKKNINYDSSSTLYRMVN